MSEAPSQTQDKFIVRLPSGMRERIKNAAEFNNRSMNAEIVQRLEKTFQVSQEVARLAIHLDLAEIDQEDLHEKLKILTMYVKEMQIAVTVNTMTEEETDLCGEYAE